MAAFFAGAKETPSAPWRSITPDCCCSLASASCSCGGRKRGTPNKVSGDVKAMILGALSDVGGRDYLARQAVENPGPFMTLIGKVLPMQVTGDPDQPIAISFEWQPATPSAVDPAAVIDGDDGDTQDNAHLVVEWAS